MSSTSTKTIRTREVMSRLKVNGATLHHWRHVVCPPLGKKLWSRPRPGGIDCEFLEREIAQIEAVPADAGTYNDNGSLLISGQEAERRGLTTIDRLKGVRNTVCSFLPGRKFCAKRIMVRVGRAGFRLVWFYSLADVEALAHYRPSEQEPTLSLGLAVKRLGVSQLTVLRWLKKKRCPFLPGREFSSLSLPHCRVVEKMRGDKPHLARTRSREISVRDINEIIENRKRLRAKQYPGEVDWRQAKELFGFSPSLLDLWHANGCPELGGRKIWMEKREVLYGNADVRKVKKFSLRELREIARKKGTVAAEDAEAKGAGDEQGSRESSTSTHLQVRSKPALETHRHWQELRDQGKSLAEIADLHYAQTGDKVTRHAVAMALARLAKC